MACWRKDAICFIFEDGGISFLGRFLLFVLLVADEVAVVPVAEDPMLSKLWQVLL